MMNRFTKCAYQSHIFPTYDGHLTNSTCPQMEKKSLFITFMVHSIVFWRYCWIPKSISPAVIPCLTDSSSISRKNLLEKSISRNTIKSFSSTDSLSKFPDNTRSSILLPIHIISHTKLNNQNSKSYFHFVIYRRHYDSNIIQTLYQTSMSDKKNHAEKRSD